MRLFTIISFIIISSFTAIWATETVEEMFDKIAQRSKQNQDEIIKYTIYNYDDKEDHSGEWLSDLILWISEDRMYYEMDEFEYYQNEVGALWFNNEEKVLRYVPEQSERNINIDKNQLESANIYNQLELLKDVCDSIQYGAPINGKTVINMYTQRSIYKKITIIVNSDYSVDKAIYYFSIEGYGYKNEMITEAVDNVRNHQITSEITKLDKIIRDNSIKEQFKDYQFLEIE